MIQDERFWKPGTETLSIKDFGRYRYDRLLRQLKYAYDNSGTKTTKRFKRNYPY
jgi:hypothetical protein